MLNAILSIIDAIVIIAVIAFLGVLLITNNNKD